MKTLSSYFLLLFTIFIAGCRNMDGGSTTSNCTDSDGTIIEQNRTAGSFHSIANYTAANIYITQNNTNSYSIRVIGSTNVVNNMRTILTDGKLRIDHSQCFKNTHQLDIYISMPNILTLETYGSGKIYGQNAWITNSIGLGIYGSGDIDIDVDATHVNATIKSSGNMKLYGTSPTINLESSGSGDFNSYGMYCQTVEAYLKSSGDVRVVASENLKGSLTGSGDLFYRGYPIIEVTDTGFGSVRNDN